MGEAMNQPTDRDREKARTIVERNVHASHESIRTPSTYSVNESRLTNDIALALAQAREDGIKSAPCNCTECWLKRNEKESPNGN